jgi:hypothetical protein
MPHALRDMVLLAPAHVRVAARLQTIPAAGVRNVTRSDENDGVLDLQGMRVAWKIRLTRPEMQRVRHH